jgi:integrase
MIRRRLLPEWQHKPIMSLRRRDAVRLTDKLIDEGKPGAAVRLWEIIRRIFNWAVDREDIEVNPMQGLKRPAKKEPRQRALSHDEMRVLWQVWSQENSPFGPLQKFLLLTGQRRGEAAKMRWSEIDWDASIWTIPAERSKNGKAHEVPLSAPARDLLASMPRFANGEYVFTTTHGQKPVLGFSKAKARTDRLTAPVAQEQGVTVGDWCIHDLRRTARTEMARIGISDEVAERVLNHAGDSLVRTYNIYAYRNEKAEALERWAEALMVIVGEAQPAENVVRLERAAG